MFKTIDPGCAPDETPCAPIDWLKCIICHEDALDEKLISSSENTRGGAFSEEGYSTLAKNLQGFYDIGALPPNMSYANLNDGDGIKETLIKHKASWHKKCYLKYNSTKLLRAQKRASAGNSSEVTHSSPVKTRRTRDSTFKEDCCVFCELPGSTYDRLRQVMTLSCSTFILENAKDLVDSKLMAKFSERSDLVALEAKYHIGCYASFRNRVRDKKGESSRHSKSEFSQMHSLAFAGLVSFINESKTEEIASPVFKLSELAKMYADGMKDLGLDCEVNTTRLKKKLLEECPYLCSCDRPGTTTLIAFRTDLDHAVRELKDRDFDDEAYALSKAAKAVRLDIFRARENFERDSETIPSTIAPASLRTLVKMIMNGPSLKSKEDQEDEVEVADHVVESIAQLLAYNTLKSHKDGTTRRRKRNQETGVPVYTAMKLYGNTRMKSLIDINFRLGLSVSYDRMISILTEKSNEVCLIYQKEGVVCPPALKKGIFTTACVDNIDHNTSATFATGSFHGTAITLMQHFKPDEAGTDRMFSDLNKEQRKSKTLMDLPESYAIVPPCFANVKNAQCSLSNDYSDNFHEGNSPYVEEKGWLDRAASSDIIAWAPYHAITDQDTEKHTTKISILPLFTEQAHSVAMMKHTADVVMKSIKYLNPGQMPVLVADQPLYALLKLIQFQFPDKYGEDKFLAFMGGLHVEMAGLRLIGNWLNSSGWVEALVQSSVTTQGKAESFLSASHVTRTRYAHQVTAVVLHRLQQKAYEEYTCISSPGELSFEDWRVEKCASVPQFKYWDTTILLELTVLRFVRSIRTADFTLYMSTFRRLVPWFFALDLANYARWGSVHLRDLLSLHHKFPQLYDQFMAGHFVARKSKKAFSAIALDQAHEQSNALLKGDGGMYGLTENPDALRKWIIAGPEIAASVESFEEQWNLANEIENTLHHSDINSLKARFVKDVENLEKVFLELGNPFMEESPELYNIDSKRIASSEVVSTVINVEELGEMQYKEFVEERLCSGRKKLMDTLKLNKLPLFSSGTKTMLTKTKEKLVSLKNDCSLFSKLYIATSEHRSGDLNNFFAHENQPAPPSIAANGELRPGKKSDLVKCLIACSPDSFTADDVPVVQTKIIDGPALVHMLNPGQSKTFQDYAENVFLPFLKRELHTVERIDVIWDRYEQDSLKNYARAVRGEGVRTRVTGATKIPKGWPNFLPNADNKTELFHFLSQQIMTMKEDGKEVYTTLDSSVLVSPCRENLESLSPCNHEEADTRIMLHVADCVKQGYEKILVRTVDTDVLVLAISVLPRLKDLKKLWVHIGTGKNHQYVAAHEIARNLGAEKAKCLPLFHALSGCDTVSSFCNRGKKSAFDAWTAYPDATQGFLAAQENDFLKAVPFIEKFIITMYDRSSDLVDINDCRKELFTKKNRPLENIPPTKNALEQHLRRAMYQAVYVWGQCLIPMPQLPSPSDWGWVSEAAGWTPRWTTIPIASQACLELIRCGCKSCASRPHQCVCRKRQLKCTELCACDAKC